MPVLSQIVTSSDVEDAEAALPPWVSQYVVMMRLLERWNILSELEKRVFIKRKDGYTAKHVVAFAVALFCASGKRVGINPFCRSVRKQKGLARKLAAAAGMNQWPTQASISRALAAVTLENNEQFRRSVMPLVVARAPEQLWRCACVRDSRGEAWFFFDLDAVVSAYRERALPEDESLPPPSRRVTARAAGGYSGRKRGEKQTAGSRAHNRGSGLWLGQHSVPGNPVTSDAVELAVNWLAEFCQHSKIGPRRIVVRMDGAGGNGPCASALAKAGVHLLARSAQYRLLDEPAGRQQLLKPVWYPVTDSKSGPRRHAADLGTSALEGGVRARMVVSAFSPRSGTKSGTGHLIGKTQFELFATTLPQEDFAPEDIVEAYYNRGGAENDYALLNEEFSVDHTFSTNGPGQDLMVQIAMLISNIQTVAGALLAADTLKPAPDQMRPQRRASLWEEPALQEPEPSSVAVPAPQKTVPPPIPAALPDIKPAKPKPDLKVLTDEQVAEITGQLSPSWRLDNGQITCPNDKALQFHALHVKSDQTHHLVMRARRSDCGDCEMRPACTESTSSLYQKELWLSLSGQVPPPQLYVDPPPPPTVDASPLPVVEGPFPFEKAAPFSEPAYVKPGGMALSAPSIVPPPLRENFTDHLISVRVSITIQGQQRQKAPRQPYVIQSVAERQHRRNTYERRLHWNDLQPEVACHLKMTMPSTLRRFLDVQV